MEFPLRWRIIVMMKTSQLAIFGGKPVRKKLFPVFPVAGR